MAKYQVRNRKRGMVAEFETQAEAAAYLQSKDDPLLYVDEIKPPPPPPPPPDKFEIWYGEMFEKRWFRCLNGLVVFGIGWAFLMDADMQVNTIAGWAGMIIGGLIAFEISLALLAIYFVFSVFDGVDSLSTPKAIVVGACIIAYVIYIKRK
jgi:hypothetical protein